MRKYFTITIIISILMGCSSSKSDQQNLEILSGIMNKYTDSVSIKKYGIGALLQKDGITSTYAIGWAGDNIPMTPDKIFNIGSLTKTFTAVLVMQEVENNTLKLSDTLGQFFSPYRNTNVNPSITIEQLLRHESGLGELVVDQLINIAVTNPYSSYNYTFLYDKIPVSLKKPGESYSYCNTNYILLGYILEKLNDRPYDDLLQERIFNPAGMKNSYAYYSKKLPNTAHPVFDGEDLNEKVSFHYYKNYAFAAGGISSTLHDLQLFFNHLYIKETFLNKATFERMVDTKSSYGLGVEVNRWKNSKGEPVVTYGHAGDNFSYKLRNFYYPETDCLIIVFSNQYGSGDPYTKKILKDIFKIVD